MKINSIEAAGVVPIQGCPVVVVERFIRGAQVAPAVIEFVAVDVVRQHPFRRVVDQAVQRKLSPRTGHDVPGGRMKKPAPLSEIGRASCRERV